MCVCIFLVGGCGRQAYAAKWFLPPKKNLQTVHEPPTKCPIWHKCHYYQNQNIDSRSFRSYDENIGIVIGRANQFKFSFSCFYVNWLRNTFDWVQLNALWSRVQTEHKVDAILTNHRSSFRTIWHIWSHFISLALNCKMRSKMDACGIMFGVFAAFIWRNP